MRIDLFLKQSRIVKRRTLAKQMCDDGFVFLNDKKAKAQSDVKTNDTITIYFSLKKVTYKVLDVPERVLSKSQSSLLYEVLSEEFYEK
ncbi:Ribosome-associated heat shock protein implicated in the recycling of the 50S subunit (S4-like) [Desulfurella amilsii]|uniref:RQC P-site tRNA stabilizing factor n=1 Tax=Desulfurella amilsii TaxID=1562698 RepID=A0A1X4XZK0_9BACT|nr:RNA-binding S4 domain-containing protein [Desulfurella amilsii]OSS42956.1 Ribosome-associated heat shock protein implicated in the recycling of the 50S subunit (S4-like) [Desulfurella amilsii]